MHFWKLHDLCLTLNRCILELVNVLVEGIRHHRWKGGWRWYPLARPQNFGGPPSRKMLGAGTYRHLKFCQVPVHLHLKIFAREARKIFFRFFHDFWSYRHLEKSQVPVTPHLKPEKFGDPPSRKIPGAGSVPAPRKSDRGDVCTKLELETDAKP